MRFKKDEIYIIDSLNYVYCYCQDNKHWFTDYPSGESIVGFVYRCKSLKNAQLYEPFKIGSVYDFNGVYPYGSWKCVGISETEYRFISIIERESPFGETGVSYRQYTVSMYEWYRFKHFREVSWDIGL